MLNVNPKFVFDSPVWFKVQTLTSQCNDNGFRGSVWTAIYKLTERSMIHENFRDVR